MAGWFRKKITTIGDYKAAAAIGGNSVSYTDPTQEASLKRNEHRLGHPSLPTLRRASTPGGRSSRRSCAVRMTLLPRGQGPGSSTTWRPLSGRRLALMKAGGTGSRTRIFQARHHRHG